jgi:hypothetical protein
MSQDENTPIDRPLMRSDLNDVRAAMHDVSQKTIAMYDEFRGIRGQFRTYVAICVACTFLSLVSAVVSAMAAAAP